MKQKVVLAFSGGLDTTYCVKYLSNEMNLEVHSAIINTGGFSDEELKDIENKAYELGVKSHATIDVLNKYYQECIKYLVFGNILKNNTYPLSVSAERVFQAMAIAKYAQEMEANYVAHGSTGAGNDQVRFDMIFNIMIPDVKIITPIRDNKLSREAEIEYLKQLGVERDWSKAEYSINKGIWGTSVGGKETLTSAEYLPDEAFPTPISKTKTEEVILDFKQGELKGINGEHFNNPVDAIKKLESIASPFGIGRDIHVGDTIIGIKGRVGFEAAAPLVIIKAHHTLEKHILTKWQQHWKEQLANWYGMMVHEGQFLDPVMRDIEAMMTNTQKNVSGKVKLLLAPERFQVLGIESKFDLMSSQFGQYGEMNNTWSGEDVKGFSKIMSNQVMIHRLVNRSEG